jgi:hypothetical protein
LSPLLCRRKLGTGRCALSVFGQHDALHQSGVDPTAEAAIRAGDAQRRILFGPGRNGNALPRDRARRSRPGARQPLLRSEGPQPVPFIAGWKSNLVGSDIDPLHGVFGEGAANRGWGPGFCET